MAAGGSTGFLEEAAVFLAAGVAFVPIFRRLGLGSAPGYLAAGMVLGPYVSGFVPDAEMVLGFAEFGVVLLLFVIGLELRPSRLWRMRSEIFGLGLAQVALTGALIAGLLAAAGMGGAAATAAGLALALSSTAFAVQVLRERGDLSRPYGRRAFAILLFQDLAIVPILALVAFLAPGAGGAPSWQGALIGLAALGALTLAGLYLLQPLLTFIARSRADEVFGAAALLVVTASALAMQAAGLSMALGAFIAGVLLAETEYRHQLESDIEPFRGLLLGLFFMGVGMTIDLAAVAAAWPVAVGGAVGLFALKTASIYGLTRLFGSSHFDAARIGATLGQGGEFGFVVFSTGAASGLFGPSEASMLAAAATLSMPLTPVAVRLAEFARPAEDESPDGMEEPGAAPRARVIIAGFGRVGQVVARILLLRGHDVTLIDNSPRRIRMAGTLGDKVYYGDATRIDVLRSAGAEEASIIFLCIDDRDGARHAVEKIKERFPNAAVLADTYDRFSEIELREAGADEVVRETFESAVELARRGLRRLGDGDVVEEVIEEFRRRDAELTRLQMEYGIEGGLQKMRDRYAVDKLP
ncbi:monovalent cation:proton antiporter-2 (CPA2) family protein [Oceanicella actignis]|uniref:monovalent cation:proton antiporter-2 (CPA2) family protein n=1 Tax=Oceanicella actignis TaxID=1189325 RepID=UPI0012553964|nr:monovalent cation:proton antiporter-2 (CPA2) family protein [Oceanicella actignis]TYO85377.1 CPA2 family monovalent cation:H+ antiporter-2/glutathione-regulated potassium-efflux system ancillary protein KefC/glutathione-regulated potassium-efflux system protein KefB [Oceanicella actignis]